MQLLCRIGESAYLAPDSWTANLESVFGREVTRRLDLAAAGGRFSAFLLSCEPSELAGAGQWHTVGLVEFLADLNLGAVERSELLATVFRLVAPTFGLRKDPVLKGEFDGLLSADNLPKGRMIVHGVENIDTAVCEVPTRLRLTEGSLMVSFDDQLTTGEVKAVEKYLGRRGGGKLAVVHLAGALRGRVLVITPQAIAIAEADIRQNPDVRTFSETYGHSLPDAVNLLAVWNADAGVELAALGRGERASAAVALPALDFRWEATHVYSMDHGLFVGGWFIDPDGILKQVWPVDHGLIDQRLVDRWLIAPAKIAIDGAMTAVWQFHAFVPRREGRQAPANVAFRVELKNGERHGAYVPACRYALKAMRDGILGSINDAGFMPDTLNQVFSPALGPVQAKLNEAQGAREIVDFGNRSAREASIVIPLYREYRFIRSQLIAFNADPYLRSNCQIVYVVDDPLIAHRVRQITGGAEHVFPLDIRLVLLERNGGYALANNLAVREAEGRALVLMNSDVAPEAPGWLEAMTARLATLPACSVIGPKLVYADESLQHAGMYFRRLPSGYWQNMHFFKGYGRDFPPANVERTVPAVTGALMVLRREDFLAVDGFTTDFIIGDYEDSDLCLKLRDRGGQCLYMPSVTLTHFERQSMPGAELDQDAGSTVYNRALHSARWADAIERLAATTGGALHG